MDGLTLSSVTGYVRSHSGEFYITGTSGATSVLLNIASNIVRKDFSQEVRLTSNFKDSWINGMVGAYYSNNDIDQTNALVIPIARSRIANPTKFKGDSRSVFGQIILTPIDQWELSAGLRYTKVKKRFKSLIVTNNTAGAYQGEQINLIDPSLIRYKEDNTSPEATLTYRPTDTLTAFISYKEGYKGPGFNLGTLGASFVSTTVPPSPAVVSPYGGEKVKGVEGGVKTTLFDNQLNLTASAYYYKYSGVQVSFTQFTATGAPIPFTSNNASAKVSGVEVGATYHPEAVEGLTVTGFANYNHGNYDKFPNANCYGGQTDATGCFNVLGTPVTNSAAGFQSLSGQQLRRAPRFVATLGFDYTRPFNDTYSWGLNVNSNYSSRYYVTAEKSPNSYQGSYMVMDATLRFGELDGGLWEVELIGRNLTNKLFYTGGTEVGQTTSGITGDITVYTNRPREFMLRFTARPQF
jgi:outer membrane receptor protein involved in Fe transport